MRTQQDFETDPTLAVFGSAAQAEAAARALQAMRVATHTLRLVPLASGRYQLIDGSFNTEVAGLVRGAEIGLPAGVALGLGMAASLGGAGPEVFAGLAGAGAVAGTLVGSLGGAARAAHYDDDVAEWLELPAGTAAALLIIETHSNGGATGRARRALRQAGALAFLDAEVYPLDETLRA